MVSLAKGTRANNRTDLHSGDVLFYLQALVVLVRQTCHEEIKLDGRQ